MADVMRDAARATLACGTARIRTAWGHTFDVEGTAFGSEGVVDLEQRLSRREDRSAKLDELVEKVARRFPWLDEEGEPDDPVYTYEQGSTMVTGSPGRLVRHDLGGRFVRDPTLILDLLASGRIEDGFADGSEQVRGAACARFGGRLPRSVYAEVVGGAADAESRPRLHVRGWIDPEGRLVRGSWSIPPIVRPRHLVRHDIKPLWRTVEFWDFGLPLDIELPEAEPWDPDDEDLPSLFEVAAELWKMRRDWKRRQRRG